MIKNLKLQTVLKYLIYACAVVPLVIFSQYISPFHFGKVVIFRSLVEIMLVCYLVLVWKDRSYRPQIDKIFWALFAFVLASTLATLTSVNTYQSFWGTLERMGGIWSFWHYFVFYIILTSVLRTKEEWFELFKVTVGVGVLSALYGFGQRTSIEWFIGGGGRVRIFGTIGNPALFAGYQIVNVFLALMLAFSTREKKQRNIWLGASALMTIAVFMTAVRGSILGISIGFVVFAFLYFLHSHSHRAKQILGGLLILGALFFVGSLAFKNSALIKNSPYLTRVTDFSLSNRTVETRIWTWEAGLKGWRENPKTVLLGWGPENFNIPFSKYFNPKFFNGPGSETLFDRAHNMFVEVLVTMGLVGFLTYVSIFVVAIMALWKLRQDNEKKIFSFALISLVVAYIIHNAFIFDTSANFIVFFTVLGFISFIGQNRRRPEVVQARNLSSFQKGLVFLLCIFVAVLIYKTNILQSRANRSATRAIVAGASNDFVKAMDYYRTAIGYNVHGKYEERNRLAQYLLDYSTSENIKDPAVIKEYLFAIQEMQKNAIENKFDYLPELYLARLNIILGKSDPKSPYNDEAVKRSLMALSYSETFVRSYYELAQAYLNKKDYKNAISAFQKAVDLNPRAGISYWYLGVVQMQSGKTEEGLSNINLAIVNGYGLSESDYLNLASEYYTRNDFVRLANVYERLIVMQPTNASYLAYLAVVYGKLGLIDKAVDMARLAAQVDPSFEADARNFVQSLGRQW